VVRGEGVAEPHADVVSGHREAVEAELPHEGREFGRHGAGVVSPVELVGPPDAARFDRDDAEVLRQARHDEAPHVPVLRPAADEE
jgi:hypothetical protein